MLKPGTDENDVKMSDVLCDFCHRAWTEDVPFIEGHRGCVICATCLAVGYAEVVVHRAGSAPTPYECALCREGDDDRAALGRTAEPGWQSPLHERRAACRRCLTSAATALERDPDFDWTAPRADG